MINMLVDLTTNAVRTGAGMAAKPLGLLARPAGTVLERGRDLLGDDEQLLGKPAIEPRAWSPPPAPALEGRFATNRALADASIWPAGGQGPEDVYIAEDGGVFTGLLDGSIIRFPKGGGTPRRVARVAGRPLGIEAFGDNLLVCVDRAGLVEVDPVKERARPLIGEFEGEGFLFTNNAAVASDGSVYFTDSSTRFDFEDFMSDIFEHGPNGRFFRYDPDAHEIELLDEGLHFANGVALTPDESAVLYAETGTYRINRRWLSGPKAGTTDAFASNLPGIPDNLSTGPSGTIWVALVSPRNPLLDLMLPRPGLRHALYLLPEAVHPEPTRHTFVLGFSADGSVTHNLQDPRGTYAQVSGVREHDGHLYLGSLVEEAVARVRLA